MYLKPALCAVSALALTIGSQAAAEGHSPTITIATVNNGDMIRMQGYTE